MSGSRYHQYRVSLHLALCVLKLGHVYGGLPNVGTDPFELGAYMCSSKGKAAITFACIKIRHVMESKEQLKFGHRQSNRVGIPVTDLWSDLTYKVLTVRKSF